jgi:hypothetical protein
VSQFEFIAVLVSIVAGLGVVRLLNGVSQFLSVGRRPYWVHLLWTFNVFHFIVFFWWFLWRWTAIAEWNLLLFLFILMYAVVMYLLCALLYPTGEERSDFKEVFYEKRKWFFALWVIAILMDIVDTYWKAQYGLSSYGSFLVVIWGLIITGSLIAFWTENRRYHAAWAIMFVIIMSTIEYVNFSTLQAN